MKRLLALIALLPALSLARFVESVSLEKATIATNNSATSVTNEFPVNGCLVSASFFCQTNATGYVSIVQTSNTLARTGRHLLGPLLLDSGLTITNLPVPIFIAGDPVMITLQSVSALAQTNASARAILIRE